MSEQEELAAQGRILADYVTAKRRFVLADDELYLISNRLRELAAALDPAAIARGTGVLDLDVPDADRIRSLVNDLHAAQERKTVLSARLRALGLEQVE